MIQSPPLYTITQLVLAVLIFSAAWLYASVGQAGASSYLAVMALFDIHPTIMRPTALVLNILVATIGSYKFIRANRFSWSLFWPFALTSIPFSYLGGRLVLPHDLYRNILGVVLLFSALWLVIRKTREYAAETNRNAPILAALAWGSAIGLISGLTGLGGGILLTPLLILAGWANPYQAAGVSVVFILVNSVAGLWGHFPSMESFPPGLPYWLVAAGLGGWLGASYGIHSLDSRKMLVVLAMILAFAGLRLLLL